MSIASFVQSLLPSAQDASQRTGLPVDFILSQWAFETGSGTSQAFNRGYNVGGIGPGTPNYYGSLDQGVNAYVATLNAPRYAGASGMGPLQIGDYLNARGYSTTPDYGSRVNSLVPQVDQVLSALGVPTGGSGAGVDPNLWGYSGGPSNTTIPGNGGTGPGGTAGGTGGGTGGCTSFFATPVLCIQAGAAYVGYIILAIVVLGLGLWAVARKAS